jgi:hypothetical protein
VGVFGLHDPIGGFSRFLDPRATADTADIRDLRAEEGGKGARKSIVDNLSLE